MQLNASGSTELGSERAPTVREVAAHFTAEARYWEAVYQGRPGPAALIYRERQAIALNWLDQLQLPAGTPVLEIGCGAGLTSVALAQRGLCVTAVDVSPAMVELTRRRAAEAGLTGSVTAELGDAHALAFDADAFPLVLAVGVLSWLPDMTRALQELARVLQPRGHLIATAENRQRLDYLLDPRLNPALRPIRRRIRAALGRLGRRAGIDQRLLTKRELLALTDAAGFDVVEIVPVGFGPFTFLGMRVVPRGVGVRLHRVLQRLAERSTPGFRSTAAQYVALLRKRGAHTLS